MTSSVHDRVQDVAREVFGGPALELRPDTRATDVAGWDLLGHVNLMSGLEQTLDIVFTDEEFTSADDVGELEALLRRKGVT